MPNNYGPRIVTDGLVLCLDAVNSKSYPGSGTVWTDLSRNSNSGTLINGPTFNTANGGGIVLDGTDDYIELTNFADNLPIMTVSAWVNVQQSPGSLYYAIVQKNNNLFGAAGWILFYNQSYFGFLYQGPNGSTYNNPGTLESFAINKWWNVVARVPSYNGNIDIFVNGSKRALDYSFNTGGITTISNNVKVDIGKADNSTEKVYGKFTIGNVMIYNRFLSDNEIRQNYNGIKGRYKL